MVKLATAHLWRVFYQFSVAVVLLTMNSQQTDESIVSSILSSAFKTASNIQLYTDTRSAE